MDDILLLLLLMFVFMLSGSGVLFISLLASNRWLWLAALCGILSGLCLGISLAGFPTGLIGGLATGIIIDLVVIPLSLLNKYYKKKAEEYFRKQNM